MAPYLSDADYVEATHTVTDTANSQMEMIVTQAQSLDLDEETIHELEQQAADFTLAADNATLITVDTIDVVLE